MSALGRFLHDLGRGYRDQEIEQALTDAAMLQIENEALRVILRDLEKSNDRMASDIAALTGLRPESVAARYEDLS